jgi:hypothetical protein
MMKKLLVVCVVTLLVVLSSMPSVVATGEGLYPFTARHMALDYGDVVQVRWLSNGDTLPGHFGWLTWDGDNGVEALVASLEPPGNVPEKYHNPGTPDNGWTPDYNDKVIAVGKWVQGSPGKENAAEVRGWLDWHIANQTSMVLPLYDALAEQGGNGYYRIASFAAFEIQSYSNGSQGYYIEAKFLRWVNNGPWVP